MTPEQAHFLLHEVYLPQIHNEHKTTCRLIEAIPADRLDYKPDEKAKSAWDLACHLASSEIFFMTGSASGVFDRAAGAIPESVKTPAELSAWYRENHAKAAARLAETSDADLTKTLTFAIFTFPAIFYPGMMINHSVHHRGQLSTYLRPMGSKIPRIYGGSADEPMEVSRAQG
jgi:uncharacterized damage-inducible protein DinB